MEIFALAGAFVAGGMAGFVLCMFFLPARNGMVARAEYEQLLREEAALRGQMEAERHILNERLGKMNQEFKLLASEALKESGKESHGRLEEILAPIKKDFGEFRKTVDESFGAHFRTQHTLKEEIGKIVLQADSLTKALKGDVQVQGNWGEIVLERILEESGLKAGLHYVLQGGGLGIAAEDGSRQKPDVVVHLPDGKHVIIDAKVSLTAYERYCAGADEKARVAHCQEFLASVRRQVKELDERCYQKSEKLGSPDFVLMFMPIEAAYVFALQQDPELQPYAWARKVVLVCPSTLFATLRTVESVWKIETQNRNVQEIARQGGALYDKVAAFVAEMEQVGQQLGRAQAAFDGAMGKLSTGRGNIIARTESLKKLGAKTSKSLPQVLLEQEEEPVPQILEEAS